MNSPKPSNSESFIESTTGWTLIHLLEVVASRKDQPSYHVFSEENARCEMFNLEKAEGLRAMRCDGSVMITPIEIEGRIVVVLNGEERVMTSGVQLLINPGVVFSVTAMDASSVQLVWIPPFAKVEVISQV